MGSAAVNAPGRDWLAILSRPTLSEFARAFVESPTLEASVLVDPLIGVAAVCAFFEATRTMYDRIAFTSEHRASSQTWLDWHGCYRGRPVSGVTVLINDSGGAIARVRLFHIPLDQLNAFAAELQHRLDAANQGDML